MRQLVVLGLVAGVATLAHAQGRGFGPSKTPSALRAVPGETTAANVRGRFEGDTLVVEYDELHRPHRVQRSQPRGVEDHRVVHGFGK